MHSGNYHASINQEIIERLIKEFPGFRESLSGSKPILRGGRCPSCGQRTLWTWLHSPGKVQCNRTNNCQWESTTRDLYPDVFENLNERYPPTPENPKATADSYMAIDRGFDLEKIRGWYTQGKYSNYYANKETATVRFEITIAGGAKVFWERLVETVLVTLKSGEKEERNKNFEGGFKGYWWAPPDQTIEEGDSVYWVEGIPDAIALILSGLKAVAIMSSGTFPHDAIKPYLNKNVEWVIALDNDVTGRKFTRIHAKRLRKMGEQVSAMLSSEYEDKADWNDLYKDKKLSAKDIDYYRYLGALELAASANEKALTIWKWFKKNNEGKNHEIKKLHRLFYFSNETYSLNVIVNEFSTALAKAKDGLTNDSEDQEVLKRAEREAFNQTATIRVIATFTIDFLYYQKPVTGEDGLYFFRMKFNNEAPDLLISFQGKIFGSYSDFKKSALQKAPGALFTGTNLDLDNLYKTWFRRPPKTVRTIDYVGYDKDSKIYVFSKYAISNGIIYNLNKDDFFQIGKTGIKSVADFKEALNKTCNSEKWFKDYRRAYGKGGLVVLAWWFGCFFAEQIRQKYRSYPFLEVVGPAASGKSDMVDFLWKLCGRSSETFNPTPSSVSGYSREMSRKSNLPVVFNETDNDRIREDTHSRRFDWNSIKDLYEGEIGRVTGRKTQDNSVHKPKFKGGLLILQNPPVMAEEAILTRIVHLHFDRSHHSPAGKFASNNLKALEIEEVSGFLIHCVSKEKQVLDKFSERFPHHVVSLRNNDKLKNPRIVDNHAQLLALIDCLPLVLPIEAEVIAEATEKLTSITFERQASIETDAPLVQQFWANFEYLDEGHMRPVSEDTEKREIDLLNHSTNTQKEISINLEHFHQQCRNLGLDVLDSKELRRQLPTSKTHKFKANKPVCSRLFNRTVRCYVFERNPTYSNRAKNTSAKGGSL